MLHRSIPYAKKLYELFIEIPKCHGLSLIIISFLSSSTLRVTPEQDQAGLRKHYHQQFPKLKLADYANGVYAVAENFRVVIGVPRRQNS
jgi:hypothetical protein